MGFRNWRWPFLSPPGRPGGLCVRHRVPSLVDRLGRPFHAFLFSHCACPPPPPGEPLCRNMFDNPHIPGGGEFPSCPTFGQPPSRLEARCPEARFAVRKHGRKRSGSTLRKRARRARWSRPPTPRPGLAPYETPLRNLGRRTKGQLDLITPGTGWATCLHHGSRRVFAGVIEDSGLPVRESCENTGFRGSRISYIPCFCGCSDRECRKTRGFGHPRPVLPR